MDEQLLQRGRRGLRGQGIEICHPGRELGGFRKDFNVGWFAFLKPLLTVGKAFSWALRTKVGIKWAEGLCRAWYACMGSNPRGGRAGNWICQPSQWTVQLTVELLSSS